MMRIYKTGDICPCCGQPIETEDPFILARLNILLNELGLPEGLAEEDAHEQ